jgi:hypothetical protein
MDWSQKSSDFAEPFGVSEIGGARCARRSLPYPPAMVLKRRRPSGFIEPCLPSKVARPPSGPLWVHKIKHDGYRLMVRRDGSRVRCLTRNGGGDAHRAFTAAQNCSVTAAVSSATSQPFVSAFSWANLSSL